MFSKKIISSVLVNFSVFPRNFFDCLKDQGILFSSEVKKHFFKKSYFNLEQSQEGQKENLSKKTVLASESLQGNKTQT